MAFRILMKVLDGSDLEELKVLGGYKSGTGSIGIVSFKYPKSRLCSKTPVVNLSILFLKWFLNGNLGYSGEIEKECTP